MLEIGKVYRQSRSVKDPKVLTVDGLPNFYHETAVPNAGTQFDVQRGIHVCRKIKGADGKERIPLIIITSSPFKAGSEDNPWSDKYDPDHGYVRYYGDNKSSGKKPEDAPGNKALLDLMKIYQNPDKAVRASEAVPLLYFERVTVDGRLKGNLRFHGFGVAENAHLVTQYTVLDKATGEKDFFSNYQFDFVVFSLKKDCENFDFIKWITARYDEKLTAEETNQYAPHSWRDWVNLGPDVLSQVRRSIAGNGIVKPADQVPAVGSSDYKLLQEIYEYYPTNTSKHKFEFLAMEITRKVIEENGASCTPGWITQQSSDHGIDYVLRLNVGMDDLSGIRIVILGQAKCTDPSKPTNGRDIARTVARLKRGWIGAYVTTSFFSESVQKEVHEDDYPLMMINGKKVAQIVQKVLFEKKMTLSDYLDSLEKVGVRENRAPEDILDL